VDIVGGASDPDLSRWSDLRVTWKNCGLALFTKSQVDSHDGAATQRQFVSAEIYSEIDINLRTIKSPINRSLTKWLLGGAISPFMVAASVFLSQSSLSNPFHNI
jgi:hypothetical protein